MTGVILRIAGLTSIYLLVLTSLAAGDVLVGGLVATLIVAASRARLGHRAHPPRPQWLAGLVAMVLVTGRDMVVGTARVVRYCLGSDSDAGFVEIPRGDRSRRGVALWGVLTGEAPDEYPVHVDDARHVMIVHLIDASEPDAVRERHATARARWQRHVVP